MTSGYTITKSNYTIKKTHKRFSAGTIYERDFMATTNLGGWDSGSIPNSENNFKMVKRKESNLRRKHDFGDWLLNGDSEEWNGDNIPVESIDSPENQIIPKHSVNSLKKYAYFGSSIELLRDAVNDVIQNFPAEAYFTKKIAISGGNDGTWYLVENPFAINLCNEHVTEETVENPLRHLSLSWGAYTVYNKALEPMGCNLNMSFTDNEESSFCNDWTHQVILFDFGGEHINCIIRSYRRKKDTIYIYQVDGGSATTFEGYRLRPSNNKIEEAFENFGEVATILANRFSLPKYTAVLDFPHDTDEGVKTYPKSFTWPMVHSYNLDIESSKYEYYINSLLELCEFYDNHVADNIWRNYTHESIKNMDDTIWGDNIEDDGGETLGKLHGFLNAVGRFFDEIKLSVENLKNNNVLTYDGNDNMPDYFLSDRLNLDGWEITSIIDKLYLPESLNQVVDITAYKEISGLFPGEGNKKYNINDVNTLFLRELKLNSRQILKHKGTKRGIEDFLSLCGLISEDYAGDGSGDYKIEEYVEVAEYKEDNTSLYGYTGTSMDVETFNSYKISDMESSDYYLDTLEGLPLKMIERGDKKYAVPYFNRETDTYFQMYGGWGKHESSEFTDLVGPYDETVKYLNMINKKNELTKVSENKLHGNDVFYVIEEGNNGTYYFLENPADRFYFAETPQDKGWQIIGSDDERVRYLNMLIDEYRGNNPHVGYANYDGGEEYVERYRKLFKSTIDNNLFSDDAYECDGELKDGIEECGFKLTESNDNMKCWFFTSENKTKDGIYIIENDELEEDEEPEVGITAGENVQRKSDMETYDFVEDNKGVNTEISADSIINVKKMKITFRCANEAYLEDYKNFVNTFVMFYIKQLIPSTCILEYSFE